MITIEKIRHKGSIHIGLRFGYDSVIKSKIKTLTAIRYSRTHGCWYIPYSKEAYNQFKQLGLPYQISKKSGTTDVPSSKGDHTAISYQECEHTVLPGKQGAKRDADIRSKKPEKVDISWHGNGFYIKLPYHKRDVEFIKSLAGSWWNGKNKTWNARSSLTNLEEIQKYFGCFTKKEYNNIYDLIGRQSSPAIVELFRTPEHPNKVMVKIKGYGADVSFIKSLPGRQYNKEFKRWEIDYDDQLLQRTITYYESAGYKVINRLPRDKREYERELPGAKDRIARKLSKLDTSFHPTINQMMDAMLRMKYSWKTINMYTGKLVKVMQYLGKSNMDHVTADEVNEYLSVCARNDVSESYLNLVHSAVKLYIEKIRHVDGFDLRKLKRPRQGKYLPIILSRQEVDRILSTTDNLKHLAILYTIYGGGLRLGEVLGLRVQDVYWDRNQIMIKGGKGKKDRMVMLSRTLKELMKKYFDEYQPVYWLFESQQGQKQYGSSSVQKIVKRAARRAGVSKRVTPHTLRHCFATHLMDGGLDSRYIQELLGHKDIKTTLIYTHVTNRSMGSIQSPLDALKGNISVNNGKKPNM